MVLVILNHVCTVLKQNKTFVLVYKIKSHVAVISIKAATLVIVVRPDIIAMVQQKLFVLPVIIVQVAVNIVVRPEHIEAVPAEPAVLRVALALPELIQPEAQAVVQLTRLQIVLVSQLLETYVLHAPQVIPGERDIMQVHILPLV